MIGIGGSRPAGSGASVEATPKLPDALPSCVAWFDGTSGLVPRPGETFRLLSWTDRISGIELTRIDSTDDVFFEDGKVWVNSRTLGSPQGALSGASSFETGEVVMTSLRIDGVPFVNVDVEHFPDGIEVLDNDTYEYYPVEDTPWSAPLVDAKVDGVSIWDDPDTFKFAPNPPSLFDSSSIENLSVSGNLELFFDVTKTRTLSPFSGQATVGLSLEYHDGTEGEGQPIISIENANKTETLDILVHSSGVLSLGFSDGRSPSYLGAASEYAALVLERDKYDGQDTIRVDLYTLVENEAGGYAALVGSNYLQLYNLGSDDGVSLFKDVSAYGWNTKWITAYDLAFFEDCLPPNEIESLLKGLKQKRESL